MNSADTGELKSDKMQVVTGIPEFGLKLKLDHVYPEKVSPHFMPSLRIIWSMFPLLLRYLWFYFVSKLKGKSGRIIMDYIHLAKAKQMYGVPIGGIGCGSIGRGFKGEFCRFQLRPGIYEWTTVDANQFIVTIKDDHQETILHSLLSTFPKRTLKAWSSCIDASKCKYTGLYPRAWTEYDLSEYGVKLTCRQISPVVPHEYVHSSLPCAVFVWDVENISEEERTVTIAFTFKNGTGNSSLDRKATCSTKELSCQNLEGVILYHTIDKTPCAYVLSAKTNDAMKVSKCLSFDPNSDGTKPWIQLKNNGEFEKVKKNSDNQVFGEMACGIAVKTTLRPSTTKNIEMSLVWHMPNVSFPGKAKTYQRYYTRYFGGDQGLLKMLFAIFDNYQAWESSIYQWQKPVLESSSLPDWYKRSLFNETYFISDGGTLWFDLEKDELVKLPESDPRKIYGRFAYLEGHEYKMYNSYDVHFYASHALHKNWPFLQRCLQYDLRDFVSLEIPTKTKMLYDGVVVERKVANSVPHDAGTPGEEPFLLPNSYNIHDVSEWTDLNSKFVLQTYRDAFVTKTGQPDRQYIEDMYNACYIVMHRSIKEALNADGLIENKGCPDQTFDTWVMTGVSAYCGGLWLAALYVIIKMADMLGKQGDRDLFMGLFEKGKEAFDRLIWNGEYYKFDSSVSQGQVIMADQLCGHWYLRCCGINSYDVFPKDRVRTALRTIYNNNVMSFCNGSLGAVNGFSNGKKDLVSIQSQEVWTGVTYALAAAMIYEGMAGEGFRTAGGMYVTMSSLQGLSFDTPEALYEGNYYRSIGYMRPLSIWSMQLAVEEKKI